MNKKVKHISRPNRRKKHIWIRRICLGVVIVLGLLLLTGIVAVAGALWMRQRGSEALARKQEALPQEMGSVSGNSGNETALGYGMIQYNGKTYSYKQDVLTFLCMGIDKKGEMEASEDLHKGGQADALFLVVLDPGEKQISVIGVNRDTMAEIDVYDEDGLYVGKRTAQIALQHAYGDGMEESCERTVDAVSHLFYGIPIHGYCALNMEVITLLNDAVGGVDVTVAEDVKVSGSVKWNAGEQVHLEGKDAFTFVQNRDVRVAGSAQGRLARQKQYLSAFINQAKDAVSKDITLPLKLYTQVEPYMVTDVGMDEAVYLATQALSYRFSLQDIYSMEGTVQMGEKFEEFYQDDEALYELILQVFYEETGQ